MLQHFFLFLVYASPYQSTVQCTLYRLGGNMKHFLCWPPRTASWAAGYEHHRLFSKLFSFFFRAKVFIKSPALFAAVASAKIRCCGRPSVTWRFSPLATRRSTTCIEGFFLTQSAIAPTAFSVHGLSMVSRKFASINRRAVANTDDASGAGLNQIGLTWPYQSSQPFPGSQQLVNEKILNSSSTLKGQSIKIFNLQFFL